MLEHIITLLLEDVHRLQQIEPDAGSEARIGIASKALKDWLIYRPTLKPTGRTIGMRSL